MPISSTSNTFRLFISSTFSDFVAEREALQKRVFPELGKFCAERGARFQAIDLRWGITEEAQQEHDTLRICLEEVRRCQTLSPRPNFAVLLGDRYGWEPVPPRIPQEHWGRLMADAERVHRSLIRFCYRLDRNAVPAAYCLLDRSALTRAGLREAALLSALRHAARRFRGKNRLPYFASATHQEIALGALDTKDEEGNPLHPEEHVNVYVRHIAGLPNDASARAFIDWDEQTRAPVQGARPRLAELERQLRERLLGKVHDIQAHWRSNGTDESHLDSFCAQFLADQKAIIERELNGRQRLPDSKARSAQHHSFAKERARNFAGRKPVLKRIAAYLVSRSKTSPLIIHGSGGTGKSALMARAYLQAVETAPRATVMLARFIGGVPGTESLITLLIELTADIAAAYGRPTPPIPESTKAARQAFEEALQAATAERPLVLFLDALDQLDRAEGAWLLEWLPKELGEHARVVASTREGQTMLSAQRRFPKTLLEVPTMTPAEGRQMLDAWLADTREAHYNAGIAAARGRRLTLKQHKQVLSDFAKNGKPLWLKLAYEEARTWPSWDDPRALPETAEAMVEDLIARRLLEVENHPRIFATRAIAYLTAGRFGLAEEELDHALATDPAVTAEFEAQNAKTGQKWQPDEKRPRLPPILWSRLYFDLQPYLATAQIDGTVVYRWFHREFKEEIGKRYLAEEKVTQTTHGHLADTFFALAPHGDDLFRYTDAGGKQQPAALRRVIEQPWQLAQAGRKEDLQTRLMDFGFCMGKCAANAGADFIEDYRSSGISSGAGLQQAAWLSLVREKGHLLRRGELRWPAHKILLQIAVEQAEDSPVTQAAEQWLKTNQCDWIWLRKSSRPKALVPSDVLAVMEGHAEGVNGADLLPNGQVLSWSEDNTLRLWDGATGACQAVLEGHTAAIWGARPFANDQILSWSGDDTLRMWDGMTSQCNAVMEGHTAAIHGALQFSNSQVLSWSEDHTLRLWDSTSGKCCVLLKGHSAPVCGVQLLPGRRILSWSEDQTLRIWDSISGKCLALLDGHTGKIGGVLLVQEGLVLSWSVDFLPSWRDDPRAGLAHPRDRTIRSDCCLRLWDSTSGRSRAVMNGHSRPVTGVQLTPDGKILSWSEDGDLRLWDLTTYCCQAVFTGHSSPVTGAKSTPDGCISSWSEDGELRLWDIATGRCRSVLPGPSGHVLVGVTILKQNRTLSWTRERTGLWDSSLRLWDGKTETVLEGHQRPVSGALLSLNDSIVSWSDDCTLRVWDSTTGQCRVVLEGHTDSVSDAQLLPDGRILSWSQDASIRVWNVVPSAVQPKLKKVGEQLEELWILPEKRILTWSLDETLRLWDCETGRCRAKLVKHSELVTGFCSLPDGRVLLWSRNLDKSWEGSLRLFGDRPGPYRGLLEGHSGRVEGARLLPDDRILSWSVDGTLRLWDGISGDCQTVLEGHSDAVWGAQVLNEKTLLSWSRDGTLRTWDSTTGECLSVLEGHSYEVLSAQIVADRRILSCSGDNTMRLWDAITRECHAVLEGHSRPVVGVQPLPGERFLSWCDQTPRVWDSFSGQCLSLLEGHSEPVSGVQLLPDGRVLTWSEDQTLRLWDVRSGKCLALLEGHTGQVGGGLLLRDEKILSWSTTGALKLWDTATGRCLATLERHSNWETVNQFPDRWFEHTDAIGVKNYGTWWVRGRAFGVELVNSAPRSLTRWEGAGDLVPLYIDSSGLLTVVCGRELLFLHAYRGADRYVTVRQPPNERSSSITATVRP
jgi:WD40 repeat protein